jgi:hypothetical protein
MKKFLMTIAAAFVAVSMNAQVYLGGSLGFGAASTQKNLGDRSETVFSILPEIGYNLNDQWAIGAVIGYQSNKFNNVVEINGENVAGHEAAFTFNPYARYTFMKAGKLNLFVDGGVDFSSATKGDCTYLGFGVKPGLAVNLTDKLSFVSHIGFLSYQLVNPDGDDNNASVFGLDLSGNNLTFGLYYNF